MSTNEKTPHDVAAQDLIATRQALPESSWERHRLRWALGIGAGAAALASFATHQLVSSKAFSAPPETVSTAPAVNEAVPYQNILADLHKARRTRGPSWQSRVADAAHAHVSAGDVADLAPRSGKGRGKRATSSPASAAQKEYAALFGSSAEYQAGNMVHKRAGNTPEAGKSADDAQGTVLVARLHTELASAPTGGPVIAILTRATRLAGVPLPRGTEIHGRCQGSGNSDTRVFMQFDFVRTPTGQSFTVRGTAVDLQGRSGVPGHKIITSKSAGSVGLVAASRAARTLGHGLAGTIGGVLGSGIEGAADAGGQKAQRLDEDEYVVVAQRGSPLQIYISSVQRKDASGKAPRS